VARDAKRGIKSLKVVAIQEGREIPLIEASFPFKGLFNQEGVHRVEKELAVDPLKLNLSQGAAVVRVLVRDYSRRGWGDGNLSQVDYRIIVDTVPPQIRAISRQHYLNTGGTGLVAYGSSPDTADSGVLVNNRFFPGFKVKGTSQEGSYVCFFAVPLHVQPKTTFHLWAKDQAGNQSKKAFSYRIRRKRFRKDKIRISDRFLKQVLPYFDSKGAVQEVTEIDRFLKINKDLRKKNNSEFRRLGSKSRAEALFGGVWLRLKNSATMARFGDQRTYYYKGKRIDEAVHLGVDLASLANAKVPAANHGQVIFSDRMGIYGFTVVLDHGQGLGSVYSHLSKCVVRAGQMVKKGEVIGSTGRTGLAGGDHLHFGIMVSGVFVNPVEWWDSHWIQDNVDRKLALLKK
jgi:murein DD-endopeptidase MepM/ murein hydrolase activator NlpD